MIQLIMIIISIILIIYSWSMFRHKKGTPKAFMAFIFGFIMFLVSRNLAGGIESNINTILKIPQVWIAIVVAVYVLILKLATKARNKYYEIDANNDYDILKRTIDFDYNPSIAGFLFDHKLDLKDLSSDILNLYAKKVVEIKKNEIGKYEITIGEKYKEYREKLKSSDQYIIEYINNPNSKFNFLKWRESVREEYNILGFYRNEEYISDRTFFKIMAAIILIGIFILKLIYNLKLIEALLYTSMFALSITFIFYIIYSNIRTRYIIPTKKGKDAIKNCIKLKKFMEGYTLLKDRTVEEICIYENYIPYAIALDVNKKYEGTIFEIFGEEIYKIIEDIEIIEYYKM